MDKQQAKGYLLEIVLSKLIEINGYDLITDNDIERTNEIVALPRNGLNIRGRGGYHQFDSLGTFRITPPFVYPLRLFLEAKFYTSERVGIDKVRMGVGILEDVNTNYSTVDVEDEQLVVSRYNYHYAIFSTTGFTEDAQRYAIAHKIQLIDLTGTEYRMIIESINRIVDSIPVKINDNNKPSKTLDIDFNAFKALFREGIFNDDITPDFSSILRECNEILREEMLHLTDIIRGRYLYLASTNSGHIIPLLTTDAFNEVLVSNAHQKIAIKWRSSKPNRWIIIPDDNHDIRITFELPKLLDKYMRIEGRLEHNSRNIKENIIKKMAFIAYLDSENPTLCTLTYNQELTDEITLDEDDE